MGKFGSNKPSIISDPIVPNYANNPEKASRWSITSKRFQHAQSLSYATLC